MYGIERRRTKERRKKQKRKGEKEEEEITQGLKQKYMHTTTNPEIAKINKTYNSPIYISPSFP